MYPGSSNEQTVLKDADRVIEFVHKVVKWNYSDIIVMGRSIGTGPAIYLASRYNICSLILISPYTSIRGVVKFMFGSLSQFFIKERFKNEELIQNVNCPTFILHGTKDDVIPVGHSKRLSKLVKGEVCLIVSETMDHNTFNFDSEFIEPLIDFNHKLGIYTQPELAEIIQIAPNRVASSSLMFSRPYFSYLNKNSRILEQTEPHVDENIFDDNDSLFSDSTDSTKVFLYPII